jgi:hypothetical protein
MAERIPVKGNDGFFLQVDKIFLDLLHCTSLNIYGVLILAQVYEFKRSKRPCIISTQNFCDLFKTSHYTIENQLKILCELNLIKKVIKTNQKNTVSRVRELSIPQNFAKTVERLLKNKPEKQPQIFEVPPSTKTRSKRKILSDLQPTNLGVAYAPEASSNFDVKQAQNSHRSNPQILRNNNIIDPDKLNNKLLEGETDDFQSSSNTPSLLSSDDDIRNDALVYDSNVSVASDDALRSSHHDAHNFDALDVHNLERNPHNLNNTHNLKSDPNLDFESFLESESLKSESKSGEETDMSRPQYPNQKNDEIIEWFVTQLNPISRYNYEIKYKDSAKNFAWGERDRKDNQKDYYTPEQIIEYFTEEKRLDYLKEIEWDHFDEWAWLIDD